MNLGRQLLLPPLIVAAAAIGCALTFAVLDQRSNAQLRAGLSADVDNVKTVGTVRTGLTQVRGDVFRTLTLIASLEDAQVKKARAALASQVKELADVLSGFGGHDKAIDDSLAVAIPLFEQYQKQCDKAIDLSGMDPNIGAGAMRAAEDTFAQLAAVLTTIVDSTEAAIAARNDRASAQRAALNAALGLLLVLAVGAAGVFAWRMQRRIVSEVHKAVALSKAVASGDLTVIAQSSHADEIGDLTRALAHMVDGLRDALGSVRLAADQIGTASAEIAGGNLDLSSRTEQTASNLQQAASSLEEITGTLGATAHSARSASQLASSAADVAERGGAVVSRVVATMNDINSASRRIADIIAVIDSIAFQTNILALNAAVEAARAGDQGRGFAVVAGEVRNLARRSAEAAREIKGLIQASVEKVDTGSQLVADAGRTMDDIVASVQRVTSVIAEISAAATEQSSGIGQISSAVGDLDRMTQQNAALVEQSASAAANLKTQAQSLSEVVGRFALDHRG